MKKYLFTLLAMLSMLMVSCNNDSTVEPDIDGGEEKACDNLGFIADGGDILGMKLSCEGIFVELGKKYAENFPDSILVVEDYTHFSSGLMRMGDTTITAPNSGIYPRKRGNTLMRGRTSSWNRTGSTMVTKKVYAMDGHHSTLPLPTMKSL